MCNFTVQKKLAPPKYVSSITGQELLPLLQEQFGVDCDLSIGDARFMITTDAEILRFLKWYKDPNLYIADEYDCDKFAWLMRAAAITWSHGKLPFGYLVGTGNMERGKHWFGCHAWNFTINERHEIKFCDELGVAAPKDRLEPAFKITAHSLDI